MQRMIHLMNLIGGCVCSYISSCITDHSWLFMGPLFAVKKTIQQAIKALESFRGMLHKLTSIDLAAIDGRSLTGKRILNGGVDKMISRLEDIFQVRSAYAETLSLLSPQQRSELLALDAFEASSEQHFARI